MSNFLDKNEVSNFIDSIISTSSVVRFHGHQTIKSQTVADHSARVAMLSYGIALEYFKNVDKATSTCTYALYHDIVEGMMKSDVNSSVKSKYGIRELIKQIEKDIVSSIFPGNSCASQNVKALFLEEVPEIDYKIIKIADTLDFGFFINSEFTLGNRQILHLFDSFIEEYSKYPEYLKSLSVCSSSYERIVSCLPQKK